MMPVYFHLQSHLWIVYLFFVNGLILHSYCRCYSASYSQMTRPLEASILAAFFLSISLNGFLLLLLDLSGMEFAVMQMLLPVISLGLLAGLFLRPGWPRIKQNINVEISLVRLVLYAFVFIILFYNGGLIEQISDAWWHMSLANKIGLESTFNPTLGHLTGTETRYYPPLWHANLALAQTISDQSIAVFWNSLTAWVGVLKVMAFYLLAFALSGKKGVAVLSIALFILLPGMGDSYLRVSAWPSHIAYTAMFLLFYVVFWIADHYRKQHERFFLFSVFLNLIEQRVALIAFILLSVVIFFVHQLELLWFFCGIAFYLLVLTIYRLIPNQKADFPDAENRLLVLAAGLAFFFGLAASIYSLISDWQQLTINLDRMIVGLVFLTLFIVLMLSVVLAQIRNSVLNKVFLGVLCVLFVSLLVSVDVRHALALIWTDLAYPIERGQQFPHIVDGFFRGELLLPGWHLQLRSALLFSGLVSIPLSIWLAIIAPSRLSFFLCGNALIPLMFCVSPYMYQWLTSVLDYHSTWRILTLLFHPIIIASAICLAWDRFRIGDAK